MKKRVDFAGALLLLVATTLALMVPAVGCSMLNSGGSFWPTVKSCVPSPATLVNKVEDVLLSGGDYESALEGLAVESGAAAVECAVKAAVDALRGKIGASSTAGPAIERGESFLAKHQFASEQPPFEATASTCGAAIEKTKRLSCGFEAADPVAWCATLTTKQVSCMNASKTASCLAVRTCTEPSK